MVRGEWTWLYIDFLFELDDSLVEKGRVGGQKGIFQSVLGGEKKDGGAGLLIYTFSWSRKVFGRQVSACDKQKRTKELNY